jgi:two-component system cell cycle sensor histidine kinase/response regulator CckA
MGKMLARLIGEDIDLMIRPDAQPGGVRADPTQLEQVLLNLCVNARDSMPDGGRLAVATEVVVPDEALLKRHAGMQPVPYVLLTIADTGMGMDAETQQHLFEPFFTTKPRGKGTGLGLATVYGIVKQSQGHVEVESEPGRGTTFRIYLPRVQMETPSLQPASQRTQARPGTEVVLLAEDEAMVRGLVLRVLRRYGYTVLEARDGQEAVDLAEQHEGHIDLLLTDVVMPRLSGPELARRVLPLRPGLKVLYMSGYVDRALGNRGRLDPDSAFLQKPFTPDQLAAKVREVLGSVGIDRA